MIPFIVFLIYFFFNIKMSTTLYKQIPQKYQIDSGDPPCQGNIQCQRIPYAPYQKPEYSLSYKDQAPYTKEFYVNAANVTTGDNTCQYFNCPQRSCAPLASCNQKSPFYKLGPHAGLSDPPTYVYSMPNQSIVYGQPSCTINLTQMPWYGSYGWQ